MRQTISSPRSLILVALLLLLSLPAAACAAQAAPEPAAPPAGAQEPDGTQERAPAVGILNARYPVPGVLTGGQPTREQLAEAAEAGYRTVINLRSERETAGGDEAAEVEKLGLSYVAIPLAGPDDLTGDNAQALADVLADEDAYPVLLHCGSGNRVGALLAVKAAYFDEKDADEALAIGLEAGLTTLEPAVRRLLGLPVTVQE